MGLVGYPRNRTCGASRLGLASRVPRCCPLRAISEFIQVEEPPEIHLSRVDRSEVEASRAQHGSNTVASQEAETFWDKLLGNLKDPIIIILIVALLITVLLTVLGYAEWYESVGIAFAVVIATFVATWSEHSNEQSFQKLLEEASMILVRCSVTAI